MQQQALPSSAPSTTLPSAIGNSAAADATGNSQADATANNAQVGKGEGKGKKRIADGSAGKGQQKKAKKKPTGLDGQIGEECKSFFMTAKEFNTAKNTLDNCLMMIKTTESLKILKNNPTIFQKATDGKEEMEKVINSAFRRALMCDTSMANAKKMQGKETETKKAFKQSLETFHEEMKTKLKPFAAAVEKLRKRVANEMLMEDSEAGEDE